MRLGLNVKDILKEAENNILIMEKEMSKTYKESFKNASRKAQEIVLLSRTRLGSNIIFVGNKKDTVNDLSSLIRTTNQWMNYM